MKLKFIHVEKLECLIGINSQIRFSKKVSEYLKLSNFKKYEIAYDENENPIKNIYLSNSQAIHGAFSLTLQNGGYFISAKKVVEELKLELPIKCKITELEKSNELPYGGLRLSFL